MNKKDFTKDASGTLVSIGADNFAFVPIPLPPSIPFDSELLTTLSEADRALGMLAGIGRTLSNPYLLINPFIKQEAVLSSKIEGTQSDLLDLYEYEQLDLFPSDDITPKHDAGEVYNYVRSMNLGIRKHNEIPISLRLIKDLQGVLLEGVRGSKSRRGEFRREQNWIGPRNCPLDKAIYVPPPPNYLNEALNKFEKYLHSPNELPPLVRLALVHYQFEAIHPFSDGNGRIGRLLLPLIMVDWNLLPTPLLYLSAYFEKDRKLYYELLLHVSQRGAWREWILYFLKGITEQSHDAIKRIYQLQDLLNQWRNKLTTRRAPANLVSLVEKLFEFPLITIPHASQLLNVSYNSSKRYISLLAELNIVALLSKKSYKKFYIARDIFNIISQ